MGPFVRAVLEQDDVQQPLRRAASILRALEAVPVHRAIAACSRAARFGAFRAQSIRQILADGLDSQPLPASGPMDPAFTPRFARSAQDFLAGMEVSDGAN